MLFNTEQSQTEHFLLGLVSSHQKSGSSFLSVTEYPLSENQRIVVDRPKIVVIQKRSIH